jgi:serine/threonine protein phosphatase 1
MGHLQRLLTLKTMKKNKDINVQRASIPKGMLIYAVGDVHGQLHLLDALLAQILEDSRTREAHRRVLIFVGDYVDRGPDSSGVIERLVSGLPEGFETCCLMGNHEAILLKFLNEADTLEHWLMNGAETTLASYGVDAPGSGASTADNAACRDQFAAALPAAHLAFLDDLKLHVSFGDYLFVHAGIRPGIAIKDQARKDFLWIRDGFVDSDADFGAVVVHGHTPGHEPVVRPNRIGIDTGAYVYGRLTALRLFGEEQGFLSAKG